jgi:hypothetical protein
MTIRRTYSPTDDHMLTLLREKWGVSRLADSGEWEAQTDLAPMIENAIDSLITYAKDHGFMVRDVDHGIGYSPISEVLVEPIRADDVW